MEFEFKLKPVYKKPRKITYSRYDGVINEFLNVPDTIVEVKCENISPHSIRLQLSNRIQRRELSHKMRSFVKNGVVFLEK